MRKWCLIFLLLPLLGFGQTDSIKSIRAVRITESPKIDGRLDEAIWKTAPIATGFTQHEPNPGAKPSQRTEVQVVYDNTAIYIAATCFDVANDSILRQLSNRDDEGNTDVFGIFLDTYNDDQNAYGFVVHPTGVQWDARFSANGQDVSWDAVWLSKVTIDDKNWYVEMKIPFSAIRFSDEEEQVWGVNFARKIRRKREFSFWNPTLPSISGLVQQFGDLTGISGIKSPVRLAFIPYLSGFVKNYSEPGSSVNSGSFRGGMDLKYGINDAFTLDLTLVPDFGQVQSDNQVLNLSQFEVFFQERRPFFTEGTELFNKSGLFYSRRIGGTPIDFDSDFKLVGNDSIVSNPAEVQLINSTKVSGRTKSNLGVGILNSVTATTLATIYREESGTKEKIETSPLTNYNVFVIDQALRNNSYVALTNTHTLRQGSYYDANVTGIDFHLREKSNTYAVYGGSSVSQIYNTNTPELGYSAYGGIRKVSGNLQFKLNYEEISEDYNRSDLGFQRVTNFREAKAKIEYNTYEPKGKFNRTGNHLELRTLRIASSNAYSKFGISTNHWANTRNFFAMGVWTWSEPLKIHDYFETRTFDRYYLLPDNYNVGGWFSSDYRKKFALDGRSNYRFYNETGRYRFNFGLSPRLRISDHLSFVYDFNSYNFPNNIGWANTLSDATIIFSRRDEHILENTLSGSYIFTNRMGLTFRVRHYWATADYTEFFELGPDGILNATTYDGLDEFRKNIHNVNFNAFNIDVAYTWVFSPGSQLSITYKNSILSSNDQITRDYLNNFSQMIGQGQTNSLNVKLLYYLDYLSVRKKSA
ncbi:MAG: carbohydrate binding family 9 domain-containing protein [Flavobacteriales bacterium]|nr:carbohydrate binding family 9 domain-containing protein [Flavobacteriales bacterium]